MLYEVVVVKRPTPKDEFEKGECEEVVCKKLISADCQETAIFRAGVECCEDKRVKKEDGCLLCVYVHGYDDGCCPPQRSWRSYAPGAYLRGTETGATAAAAASPKSYTKA